MNLKILFAESRFDQLQYFAGLLKEEGHEVFPYQSGQTVIDTVRGGLEYDLGIIDSTLLGLKQGEEVMRELKQINVNNIILREFFEFFNFDFHHTGYSKEAEMLGVI